MLKKLIIKNYLLIEKMEIDFDNQLTAIIGESGSGKSMILDAIEILLNPLAKLNKFPNLEIELISDKHRYYKANLTKKIVKLDDKLVSSKLLSQSLAAEIDLNRQFSTLNLIDKNYPLALIDSQLTENILIEYQTLYQELQEIKQQLTSLEDEINNIDLEYLNYQLSLIENLNINQNLELKLQDLFEQKSKLIKNAQYINQIEANFDNNYLSVISQNLVKMEEVELANQIDDLQFALEKIKSQIIDKYQNDKLVELEDNLQLFEEIKRLRKKLNCDFLYQKAEQLNQKIDNYHLTKLDIINLKKQYQQLYQDVEQKAQELSKIRQDKAQSLTKLIVENKDLLALEYLALKFQFNNSTLTSNGIDEVDLLVSFNHNLGLTKVAESLSGGELSRLYLLIKSLINQDDKIIIFDEIDSGVSGKMSLAIANCLKRLSQNNQIILITHQSLILVKADTVFLVAKNDHSYITKLDHESLIKEIALLTSATESKQALLQAQEIYDKYH